MIINSVHDSIPYGNLRRSPFVNLFHEQSFRFKSQTFMKYCHEKGPKTI